MFLLNGLVAAYVFFPYVPLIELTSDVKTNYLDSKELFHTLWKTMQLYAIIVPTSFVLFYNSFQLSNASWNNFLILGKGVLCWCSLLHHTDVHILWICTVYVIDENTQTV